MNIHIALYKWKDETPEAVIAEALHNVELLPSKVPGLIDIVTGTNTSKYSEGYTHVIIVRAENQTAIDAYRHHPDHAKAAKIIESIELQGIGIDIKA